MMSIASLDWDLVATYLAVCRTGSLSGAARARGLSHPTVRAQVERIEALVGSALFLRTPAGLVPVEGSAALVAEAEAMEIAAAAFRRRASAPASEVSGTVRIAASGVVGVELLPPVLAALRRDWPDLRLELVLSNRLEVLSRREADVAVRLARPTQGALVARRVAPVALGFFAAPARAADLAGLSWEAACAAGVLIGQDRLDTIAAALRALGRAVPGRLALATDDDLAQLAAIRAGVGAGVAQVRIAARDGLVRLWPEIAFALEAFVVMPEDLRRVARVRTVFDALVAALV
jgi:DNA-binding transcriptional LysR family regulator